MVHMVGNGFEVTVPGRAGLIYREGSKTVRVSGEMLLGPTNYVVYGNSIRAWEGSSSPITDAERDRIKQNIEAVFKQNNLIVEFA
jgi:hypothetical protein